MTELIEASRHECFRLGFMTCAGLSLVVSAVVGWVLIVVTESNWDERE